MTGQGPMLGTAREWAIDLSVATAMGAFLGMVGPFGSYFNGPFPVRAIYWIGCFWAGILIFGLLIRLAAEAARRTTIPAPILVAVAILVGSGLQAVVVAPAATALWPFLKRFSPLDWYGQCLAFSGPLAVGFTFLRARLASQRAAAPLVVAAPAPSPAPAPLVAASVLYLKMEDHYVRVRTETGSRLEAGPMARVLEGLSGLDGLQVHRSWWVSRRAVAGIERDGRNLRLRLVDGETAPVARASVARLRAAGWLAADESSLAG
ncbi:LytTR family DNA-binding domain-containing protein [Caulobacter hibisci]|uniref:LytTR family transcriptional regulator DNA-binding domain-containing protein n=1 Tax=Caulobacter hibisci TaxID=2035993 RepID=A0ABS0T0B5_9CAUL|nr:LytTR family DNA-binding domain-containing protein [Caulobacter hibisci]MBI1685239.1 LytTR family transcriptional regulator DNA-binding domain-containing protein [Caulobacter hibisci]